MKFAVVPVSCSDAPRVTTLTREWLHRATTHVAGYFLEQSGGRELMVFRVFEWTALPVTSVQWNGWGFDAGDHVRPLVSAAQHVNLDVYDHWAFIIDKPDASLAATRPSDRRYMYVSARDFTPALLAHELGHMFNANHARLQIAGGEEEYGDGFCIMGAEGGKFSFEFAPLDFRFAVGQPEWRYCGDCMGMFFDGYPDKGRCPGRVAGGHRAIGYSFVLPHDTPGPGQHQWRYCEKCHGMYFDGYRAKGVCPAGGTHAAAGYDFVLPHDVPGLGQSQWRYCHRCMGLFFDGYPTKGRCPAGGNHEAQGYEFQLPFDIPAHDASGPNMVAPSLLACNWLNLGDARAARDVSSPLATRPAEMAVELAALSGAPPPDPSGAPSVAWTSSLVANQTVFIEYRSRISEYDQALPASENSGPGWVLLHLSTGQGRSATSLRVGCIPAEVGATTYMPEAALNVSVIALDRARDTVVLRLASEVWPPDPGQANWRYCHKCQSMFFDGYPTKGRCMAGGTHIAAGYNFVLKHDIPGDQASWRYCRKCEVLYYDGYAGSGRCVSGGHVAEGFDFSLLHDVAAPGQSAWRFCSKCQALYFDGYPTKGTCAAGGAHTPAGFNFVLPHDDEGEAGQRDWRYCGKCQAMFYDGYPQKGQCPAGGGHASSGYNFHLPHDTDNGGQSAWRYCRNCHAMFYDGYATKGVCPAAGHEAAGYNFVVAHDSPGPGQTSWRFCSKCSTMFYDGYPTKGRCPADGKGHVAAGHNFRVEHKPP